MGVCTTLAVLFLSFIPVSATTGGVMRVEVTIEGESLEESTESSDVSVAEESQQIEVSSSSSLLVDGHTPRDETTTIEDILPPRLKELISNTVWFLLGDENKTPLSANVLLAVGVGMLLIVLLLLLLLLLIVTKIVYKGMRKSEAVVQKEQINVE